ncbi:MAG: aromatic-ring-hydroxylating dioxygenase subunit beta, partial [Pseudomonadota bacterium]|nr:aromatic-ring-hydroxylating dioxygenase subunit beta [Pseudomonadota bacterium]
MDTTPERALFDQLLLRHQVEQFYNAEAELLDSRQFNAWLDLLTDDVRYWMPVTINKEYGEWDK